MLKLILFVRRKRNLTHEGFRAYYESNHAPLAKSKLPHLVSYTRKFLVPFPGQPEPLYDCITEFGFDDQAGLEATLAWTRSEAGQVLARDEENFMDRASMRVCFAEEFS